MNTGLWKMGSGLAAARRPGMTNYGRSALCVRIGPPFPPCQSTPRAAVATVHSFVVVDGSPFLMSLTSAAERGALRPDTIETRGSWVVALQPTVLTPPLTAFASWSERFWRDSLRSFRLWILTLLFYRLLYGCFYIRAASLFAAACFWHVRFSAYNRSIYACHIGPINERRLY